MIVAGSKKKKKKKAQSRGGETNRICLSTSQQLLRGSLVDGREIQLRDEIKRGFINAASNTVFSPKASVESRGLMYTQ